MKLLKWIANNSLFFCSLFLLAFIPLYPKLPLISVTHINVYIRLEDFLIFLVVLFYLFQVVRKKASWRSPLTIAIFSFWLVGLVATILGLIFIFPHLSSDPTITSDPGIYIKNAFLFFLRHIEYLSLFFVAYASIKEKKQINILIIVLLLTLTAVVGYGFGQRFLPHNFPAFSTMDEESAKGIPMVLDAANRLQSTFAGHYDFAAYMVMLIPLVGSLIFGYKKWWIKIGLALLATFSLIALMMTASRTSFAMYLLAISFMLILQKQKKWIIPVIIISLLLLHFFNGLYSRYAATFSIVNRVIDTKTGKLIGYEQEGENGEIIINKIQPQGSGVYPGSVSINTSSSVTKATHITVRSRSGNSKSIDIQNLQGNFVIQRAQALDASITTRLQAEWPNAIKAFLRDPLFGSGYSSITLATDGNYFRFLGETGILGFMAFGLIFLIYGIYVYRILPLVNSKLTRSFVLGVSAGIFGLGLNAVLIDVFEASKIAYTLWLMVGITVGILHLYKKEEVKIHMKTEIINVLTSLPAIGMYLFVLSITVFYTMFNNYFVADDFTWFRWVSDCRSLMQLGVTNCQSKVNVITDFFLHSPDFFYRPAMKTYMYLLYNNEYGWLNPVAYHIISLLFHLGSTILVLLISIRILRNKFYAFTTALIFLILASHGETIYWVAASGHLFASFFILLGLYLLIKWQETKKLWLIILSAISLFLAPLFQEFAVIGFILIPAFDLLLSKSNKLSEKLYYLWYAVPFVLYFCLKISSKSLWSAGDYTYNILKLPFNFVGNLFGFFAYSLIGTPFLGWYSLLRANGRQQILLIGLIIIALILFVWLIYELFYKKLPVLEKKTVLMSVSLFIIPSLPFLGFGNMAPRYTYLASFAVILFLVFIIQKLFSALKEIPQIVQYIIVFILTILFSFYQINQLTNTEKDWQHAGTITDNVLQYMNNAYEDQGLGDIQNPVFYFVNVPIRIGEAWVFPVGLSDAVWFDYKKNNATTNIVPNLNIALAESSGSESARIFVFDKNGNLSNTGASQ